MLSAILPPGSLAADTPLLAPGAADAAMAHEVASVLQPTFQHGFMSGRVASTPEVSPAQRFESPQVSDTRLAQAIVPAQDGTATQVEQVGDRFDIQGGIPAGPNLFHSFEQFNVESGQTANFLTRPAIQNILGRVVGGDASYIQGLIQVTGGASNLYLMNPAGIVFGATAQLDVPASFTATTATAIGLGDRWFQAVGPNSYSALVGMPNQFEFATPNPGAIWNEANLAIAPGHRLTLLGGSVISPGSLSAPEGQVLIGAGLGQHRVRLSQQGMVLSLDVIAPSSLNAVDQHLAIAPLTLPELLTGGGVTHATGVRVAADGTIRLTETDAPLAPGDVVTQNVTAGSIQITSLRGNINTQTGTLRTHPTTANDLGVRLHARGDVVTADVQSQGGPIALLSTEGGINTRAGMLDSSRPDGVGGAVTLHSLQAIATDGIRSGGGPINLTSRGVIECFWEFCYLSSGGTIETDLLDSTTATGLDGDITLHAVELPIARQTTVGQGTLRLITPPTIFEPVPGDPPPLPPPPPSLLSLEPAVIAAPTVLPPEPSTQSSTPTPSSLPSSSGQSNSAGSGGLIPSRATPEPILTPTPSVPGSSIALNPPTSPHSSRPDSSASRPSPEPQIISPSSQPVPNSFGLAEPGVAGVPNGISAQAGESVLEAEVVRPELDQSVDLDLRTADLPQQQPAMGLGSPQPQELWTHAVLNTDADCGGQAKASPAAPETTSQLLACYRSRLAEAEAAGNAGAQATLLHNLGTLYYTIADYTQAMRYYRQQLVLAESLQHQRQQQQALRGLGAVHGALGDYDTAIATYQRSLELARALAAPDLEAEALSHLGLVYHAQGAYAQAIAAQAQSLAIAQRLSDRHRQQEALSHLGLGYYALTDYDRAIAVQQESLAIAQAQQDLQGIGRAWENLGLAYYAQADYDPAIAAQQESLRIAKRLGDRHAEGRALSNLGDAYYRAKQPEAAIQHLLAAIDIWESLRAGLGDRDLDRISIFETQETTYSTLQEVLVAQGQIDAALEITERGRARAFVELLNREVAQPKTLEPRTQPDLAAPNLAQIRQIAQAQQATLVSYSVMQQVVEMDGMRQLQEADLYIWVVKPTGEVVFRRSDLSSLTLQEGALQRLITGARCGTCRSGGTPSDSAAPVVDPSLRQLHQILIEPIADLLPPDPSDRIIFIPHQALFLVPFPALQDAAGTYLIEQHTMLTAPSIQVLALTHQRRQQQRHRDLPQTALIVGNPTMPRVPLQPQRSPLPLAPLPGAEVEALEIADLLKAEALIGHAATEAAVVEQLPQARVIHLATHGLLEDLTGFGIPGAIALAPSDTADGLLTASEILNLNLNAELVVLSACDTGRGRITGDGVVGLSRAWMATGVPSVVVSLWKVPDIPTLDLMTEFYRQMQRTPDKAQALRQAMLITRQQHPDPVDWAGFTLMGEAQ